jgi:hypothetical protein
MYLVALFTVATAAAVVTADENIRSNVKIDSLPIAANFKVSDKGATLVDRDRARFKALFTRGKDEERRAESVALKNTAVSLD